MRSAFFFIICVLFLACFPAEPTHEQKIEAAVKKFEQDIVPLQIGATDVCVISLFYEKEGRVEMVKTIPPIPCNVVKNVYPVLRPESVALIEVLSRYSSSVTLTDIHVDSPQDRFRKLLE